MCCLAIVRSDGLISMEYTSPIASFTWQAESYRKGKFRTGHLMKRPFYGLHGVSNGVLCTIDTGMNVPRQGSGYPGSPRSF
jgi:hypothetical protein